MDLIWKDVFDMEKDSRDVFQMTYILPVFEYSTITIEIA